MLPNVSKQTLGGGWTFLNTFDKYARRQGHKITLGDEGADVVLISGATMLTRDFVTALKQKGKRIVLRVDNIPRNSRNRNTGTSRLYDFAQMADLVVYQSEWAKAFIAPFLGKDGPVILNGADEDVFRRDGTAVPKDGEPQYLFSQFNRDETKCWPVAWYEFIQDFRKNPKAHLWLVGQFSPELQETRFDFFQNERFHTWGVVDSPMGMAEILRGVDVLLAPYYNDACSNTIIEARLCGVPNIISSDSGGSPEIMDAPLDRLRASYMVERYIEAMASIT